MNYNENLVSIIIPAYNVQDYIEECLNSITNQTYKNIEIIVVNDGSSDNTKQIIQHYAELDERIILLNQENKGLSGARNSGIEVSKGEFITFVDSDDFVDRNYVEFLISKMLENELDLVSCNYITFGNDDESINGITPYKVDKIFNNFEALNDLIYSENFTMEQAPQKIYKRSIFDTLRFEPNRIHEDAILCVRSYYSINKGAFYNVPLYHYRQREGSITKSKLSIKNLDKIYAYETQIEFFNEINYTDICPVYKKLFSSWIYIYLKNISSKTNEYDEICLQLKQYYFSNKKYIKYLSIVYRLFFFMYEYLEFFLRWLCYIVMKIGIYKI